MPNATLLIVDDDDSLGQGLRLTLRRDFRVLVAERAAEGLELLETHHVDVVMSDHLMPELTGLEFLKTVARRWPETVRIMLTGHADAEVAIEAINHAEVFRLLSKPVEPAVLRAVLQLALERVQLTREVRALRALVARRPELQAELAAGDEAASKP